MITRAVPSGNLRTLGVAACLAAVACAPRPKSTASAPNTLAMSSLIVAQPSKLERDKERRGAPPNVDSLGGPYGKGVYTQITPHRATPSPSARIDISTTDSALVRYLNELVYESSRDRSELAMVHCTPNHPACPPNAGVPMYIQAEWGMSAVSHSTIPFEGVIVARIINFDSSRPGGEMGVPPLTRAWWYVYKTPLGLKSIYFTRTHNTTGPAITILGPPKDFGPCPTHMLALGQPARAKWGNCTTSLAELPSHGAPDWSMAVRQPLILPASFNSAVSVRSRMAIAADTWVTCMATCCSG